MKKKREQFSRVILASFLIISYFSHYLWYISSMGKIRLIEKSFGKWPWKLFPFCLIFFTFLTPFTANAINTIKIHRKGLNFFMWLVYIYVCLLGGKITKKLQKKIFFCPNPKKNHFFQFWWNGGHIPSDDWKTYFPQHKPCAFRFKTLVIYIFYDM